jgi:hypothetical protein
MVDAFAMFEMLDLNYSRLHPAFCQRWSSHPSSRLFGAGYSSDITSAGPEPSTLIQSSIPFERLETKKEERRTVNRPSSLLLKSPRAIDLKHGISVREADSIVGLNLDPIAVRMIFLQLVDSLPVRTYTLWNLYSCIFH